LDSCVNGEISPMAGSWQIQTARITWQNRLKRTCKLRWNWFRRIRGTPPSGAFAFV